MSELLILMALTVFAAEREAQPPAAVAERLESGLRLLREGDAQADSGKVNEAQVTYHEAMEQVLPSVRRLPFRHPVKRDETPREQLGKVLVEEWEKEVTPEKFRRDEATWKVLGLIPAGFDLKAAYVKLLTEEVAAFYDPKTKTMHLIREPEKNPAAVPANDKPKNLLELIMGREEKFDKDGARAVIAHELTHALGDQHHDLDALMSAVQNDDDAALALSALMEGDATLAMMAVAQQDWGGTEVVKMPAAGLARLVRWFGPFLPMMGGATARNSPPVMYESLLFPYVNGLVFTAHLANSGGWAAVDKAYAEPPLSTEQILHPEKYAGPNVDVPMAIDLGAIDVPEGYVDLGRSVIGELTIRIMLSRNGGPRAAAGWDGDTLGVFRTKSAPESLGMIWMTTWDSAQDSEEFADALSRTWSSEINPAVVTQAAGTAPKIWTIDGGFIQSSGNDVLVVRGFQPKIAGKLAGKVWSTHTKKEKRFQRLIKRDVQRP